MKYAIICISILQLCTFLKIAMVEQKVDALAFILLNPSKVSYITENEDDE